MPIYPSLWEKENGVRVIWQKLEQEQEQEQEQRKVLESGYSETTRRYVENVRFSMQLIMKLIMKLVMKLTKVLI